MKLYDYNGEMLTVKKIAEKSGLHESAVRYRLNNNKSFIKKETPCYTFNGESLTIREWSNKLNIGVATLNTRLRLGLEYDKVFSSERLQKRPIKRKGIYYDPKTEFSGTRKEMAEHLNVTTMTVHLWSNNGKLIRKESTEHIGKTINGWIINNESDAGLLCECEICKIQKSFKRINNIKRCDNVDEHHEIQANNRLIGRVIKGLKIDEVLYVNGRNARVNVTCINCNNSFEVWETNAYKGCRCKRG